MKKILIPFLLLAALLTFIKIGFALSGPTLTTPNVKQLLADGDMEAAGTTSWSAIAATVSKQTTNPHGGNQVLRVTADGTQYYGDSYQSILTNGKRYRITGWARGDGVVYPSIFFGGNNQVWSGTVSTAWQRFDVTGITIGGPNLFLIAYTVSGAGQYVEFDDVFITEVTGYTQVQDTQKLVDGDLEKTNTQPSFVNLDFEGAAGPPPASWSQFQALATRVAGTRTGGSGSYVAHVAYDTVNAAGLMYQDGLTAGHTYRVTGWYRTDGIHMLVMLGPTGIIFNDTAASWTYFDATGIQAGGDNYLRFQSNDFNLGAGYFELDDVSVTDVTAGSWLTWQIVASKQTTSPHGGKQVVRAAYDGSNATGLIYQTPLTVGKRYRITGWMRSDGFTTPIFNDGSLQNFCYGTTATAWQYCDQVFVAQNNNVVFQTLGLAAGRYAEYDDVMVTEDKGKQQVIDKQVVVEGDMEGLPVALADAAMEAAGTASWVALSGATLSKQTTNPHGGAQLLRVARNGANVFYAYQSIMTAGHTYRVTGYARSDGTTTPNVSKGSAIVWTGTTATSWQSIDVTFVQDSGTVIYFGDQFDSSGYVEFDDISVVDIGTTAWSPGSSNATLTKTTTGQHGGEYALRAAWGSGTYVYASGGEIFTPGKKYRMTGWVRSDGTVTPTINISGGQNVWTGTTATSWQRIDVTFTPLYGSLYLLYYASGAAWVEWDDLYATLAE